MSEQYLCDYESINQDGVKIFQHIHVHAYTEIHACIDKMPIRIQPFETNGQKTLPYIQG